jgi:translation initiation factor IF-3
VTLRFRGREMAHQDLGLRLLERVKAETQEIAKVLRRRRPRPERSTDPGRARRAARRRALVSAAPGSWVESEPQLEGRQMIMILAPR